MSSASNPGGPPSGPPPPPAGPSSPSASPSKSSTTPPPPPSSTDPPPPTGPASSSTPPSTSATETSSAAPTSSSTPPPTTAPPTTATPTPTPTPRPITTPTTRPTSTNSQAVVTKVSTQFVSPTLGATANADHNRSSKGFFDNTGAVAGVFSVVGLIGLAIIIALIANTIRRRRARKFDKELAAATLEAASAPKPVFLDDDEDEHGGYGSNANSGYGGGAHGGGGYGAFSDASSHGTYSQQPMSIGQGQESYGMRELQHHAPVQPGELFDPYAAGAMAGAGAAGAAGIGVARARSHRALQDGGAGGSYGAGLQEGGAPYAAFAAPGHQQQPPHMPVQEYGGRNPNLDVMEAAGLGAHVAGAGALARNQSKSVSPASTPAQDAYGPGQGLERNKSLGSYDAYAAYPAAVQQQQPQAYYNSAASPPPVPSGGQAQMYGGYGQQSQSYQFQSHQQQSSSSYQQHSSSYQTQTQQQQSSHTRGYSDAGVEEDDAYGGYVVEDEPPSPSHHQHPTTTTALKAQPALLTPGTAGSRSPGSDALPNPFERPMASSQGHGGYAEYDERDRASSDDGDTDAEPPRRVLKVANE